MKRHAFTERLDQLGVEWIIDVERPTEVKPNGRSKKGPSTEPYEPNLTGTTIVKKWPINREWCKDCNQLVEGKKTQIKITDRGQIIKCYCGKKFPANHQKG
jgi:hypothetical protein